MLKVLIWQVSDDTRLKDKAIKILEQQHNGIEIVGESVNENIAKVDGGGQYDVLLCVGAKKAGSMSKVTADAHKLGLPEEKLLGDWIVTIPGFTLQKYRHLQRSRLSIFSKNCFGGVISHTLGLVYRSPFVNLDVPEPSFMKFLSAPHTYMEKEFRFDQWVGQPSPINPHGVPRFLLDDLVFNMVHYKEIDECNEKWASRKQRINWYNILVVMYTNSLETLQQFDELPFGKKVCFVPFPSDLDSAFYINPKLYNKPIHSRVIEAMSINFAYGHVFYYDPFDMLLYGKKTPLIDMEQ